RRALRGLPPAGTRGRERDPSPPDRATARQCSDRRSSPSNGRNDARGGGGRGCPGASFQELVRDGGEDHVRLEEQQPLEIESTLVVEQPPPPADDDLRHQNEDGRLTVLGERTEVPEQRLAKVSIRGFVDV